VFTGQFGMAARVRRSARIEDVAWRKMITEEGFERALDAVKVQILSGPDPWSQTLLPPTCRPCRVLALGSTTRLSGSDRKEPST
jgi:hypothetical protein